ncbi:unnamed protein product [Phytophthora fragariaefolia]|uniref:Unnamed protein product n=1 Tax=Phytophthora fragariaefolia TaxID=1490495 RepID=A0A9W6X004_9STRA|nr:unnamed protein product [Phytophthora fragariaefolia]
MYANRDPKPGSMTPGTLELQLRCFAVKEDLAAGHCWPASTQLSVNGFGVPITQRAPPGHANPSKVLRELPANIFQYSRVGRNVVDVQTTENPSIFGFMVQIVEVRNINDLINEVKEASKNLTYESAKQEVIKSFGSEDEDDVVATVTMLSVRCPLGLCFIKASDLRIDPYLKKLLAEVEGEEELEEVEIFPDGSWKRRLEEELIPEPPSKKVKAEEAEVSTASTSVTSTSAASANDASHGPPGSSATAPVEIDLLSSDDEDEDTGTTNTSAPSTAAAASSSTPILLDDDIDILTVTSDAWDTPASTSTSTAGDGNCGEYFPFPLDENLFPSNNAATSNTGNSSSWLHSESASTIVNSMPPPASTVAVTSAPAVSPPQEVLNQAESNLASSMASLSRNHNVSNPFDQRQRRQARPPPKPGATNWAALNRQARKTQEALSSSARTKGRKTLTGNSIDYLAYLASFSDFSAIPPNQKTQSAPYQQYLKDLKEYLLDFYRRTQPLVDLDDVIEETSAKFEKQWALHEVAGWDSKQEAENADNSKAPSHFCELCNKQFSSEGVYNGHLSGKKHKKFAAAAAAAKSANGTETNGTAANGVATSKDAKKELEEKRKSIAFNEVLIRRMYELLTEVVQGTISYLELKQTRTHEELQAEIEEEEEGAFSDVDVENENDEAEDEEEQLYNPLNLPLGWDGKPIPYWLYKLHGLGVEYKCEICGNHSYWGRRAFDRHFQEWRHAFGMRCLKIPNTKHFHDITLMRDAIQLYEKLKDQIDAESWNASNEEEFEDSEGNVLNRKTYEDLARQGLL